ncbi:MAG: hypothetical protein R3F53_00980 [Gammaproteobacteria bacterium]
MLTTAFRHAKVRTGFNRNIAGTRPMQNSQASSQEQTLSTQYDKIKARNLNLDLTRGKPGADQLDLSNALDGILDGNFHAEGLICAIMAGRPQRRQATGCLAVGHPRSRCWSAAIAV